MPNRKDTTTGRRLIACGQRGSKKGITVAGSAVVASRYQERGSLAKDSDSTLTTDLAQVGPKGWCFVRLATSSLTQSQAQDEALSLARALGADFLDSSVTRYGDTPR